MNRNIKDATINASYTTAMTSPVGTSRSSSTPTITAEDPAWLSAIRICRSRLDRRPNSIQSRPVPLHNGTKHRVSRFEIEKNLQFLGGCQDWRFAAIDPGLDQCALERRDRQHGEPPRAFA